MRAAGVLRGTRMTNPQAVVGCIHNWHAKCAHF